MFNHHPYANVLDTSVHQGISLCISVSFCASVVKPMQAIGYDEKVALEEKYSQGEEGDKLRVRVPGKSRPGAATAAAGNGAR